MIRCFGLLTKKNVIKRSILEISKFDVTRIVVSSSNKYIYVGFSDGSIEVLKAINFESV